MDIHVPIVDDERVKFITSNRDNNKKIVWLEKLVSRRGDSCSCINKNSCTNKDNDYLDYNSFKKTLFIMILKIDRRRIN